MKMWVALIGVGVNSSGSDRRPSWPQAKPIPPPLQASGSKVNVPTELCNSFAKCSP